MTRRKKERSEKCVVEPWERCHGNVLRNPLRNSENSIRERRVEKKRIWREQRVKQRDGREDGQVKVGTLNSK